MKFPLLRWLAIVLSIRNVVGFSLIQRSHPLFLQNGQATFPKTTTTTTTTSSSSSSSSTALFALRRGGRPRGPVREIEDRPTMNEEIRYDSLRCVTVDEDSGKDLPLGILSKAEAISKAKELGGLDVILVNDQTDPPVCRILEYSKFRFMKQKKAKEKKKNVKGAELKEVKMSYKIGVHDYGVRKKNAEKFIMQGSRVKCTVLFRGREVQHDKLGFDLLERLADELEGVCSMEGRPKKDGRNLSCILNPKQNVIKTVNDKKRADEKQKKSKRKAALEEKAEARAALAEEEEQEPKGDAEEIDMILKTLTVDGDDDDMDDDDDDVSLSLDDLLGDSDLGSDLFS